MLKLNHDSTLNHFIDKFNLNNIFSIELNQHLELHCFNKDELICIRNKSLEYLYFLVDGSAKSFNDSSIKYDNLYSLYSSFSIIGALELFNESKFNYNIKALEECICVGIHYNIIYDFFLNDLKFLKYFCKNFSNKLSTNHNINLIGLNNRKRDVI